MFLQAQRKNNSNKAFQFCNFLGTFYMIHWQILWYSLRFLIGCFNKLFLWFVFLIRTAITQPSNEILMNVSFLDYFRSSSEKTDNILKLKSVLSPVKTHLIFLLNTFYLSNWELKNRNISWFVCILLWYKGKKKKNSFASFSSLTQISASVYLFSPQFIWK